MRVLAVDDDPVIVRVVQAAFDAEGFDVATAGSVNEALRWIGSHGLPDLGVFDLNMPARSGLDLARELHAYCDVPILFLTVVDDEATVVDAIERHAEDYLRKPFRPRELVARAKRVLRRFQGGGQATLPNVRVDDRLALSFPRQVAHVEDREIALTPIETKILHILHRASPRVVATEYLLRRIWPDEDTFEDTLRVHVHRIRHKIERDPSRPAYLLTHRNLGYGFRTAEA